MSNEFDKIGIVTEAMHIIQAMLDTRPAEAEKINAAMLALAEHAASVQAERDELLEALSEATNRRRPPPAAERVFTVYLQERGRYRDAGDLECQLDEAMGEPV